MLSQKCNLNSDLYGEPALAKAPKRRTLSDMQKLVQCGQPECRPSAASLDKVAGFLQSVASAPVNDVLRSWCVLIVFALFPKSQEHVMGATERKFATFFFGDARRHILPFDLRFCLKLCGSSTKQAMLPSEIVVSEWQLFTIIDTS